MGFLQKVQCRAEEGISSFLVKVEKGAKVQNRVDKCDKTMNDM